MPTGKEKDFHFDNKDYDESSSDESTNAKVNVH